MDRPAVYRIQVARRLEDQAAVSGVVNALYELHLPVLSVEGMTEEEDK